MITWNDGYHRKTTLRDGGLVIHLVYRPASRRERDSFRDIASLVGQKAARIAICEWLSRHIVLSDIASLVAEPHWISVDRLWKEHEPAFKKLWNAVNGLIPDAAGRTWVQQEGEHQANLREGLMLELTNPRLARRSCEECKIVWYSEKTGLPIIDNHTGKPMARAGDPPCMSMSGCAKGTPEKQRSLSRMNRMAFRHFRECEATIFPDDSIVTQNAAIIRSALESKKK